MDNKTLNWFLLVIGGGVGAWVIYNYYVDPYIRISGPIGMSIWKRQSQITPQELEFERKVQSGEVKT